MPCMREHGHALACACDTVSEGVCALLCDSQTGGVLVRGFCPAINAVGARFWSQNASRLCRAAVVLCLARFRDDWCVLPCVHVQ